MSKWIVAKFGGSSVKDGEGILRCVGVVDANPDIKSVVISATQNTTNHLEFIARAAANGDAETLASLILELTNRHTTIANDICSSEMVHSELEYLYKEVKLLGQTILNARMFTPKVMDQLYSVGERMSSLLVSDLIRLRIPDKKVILLDARDVIKTNSDFQKAEPQIDLIALKTREFITPYLNTDTIIVTQGFIGQDLLDNTTTLGREGSDYSAALFGEAIDASVVQIWTDVAGIASADPRIVKNAKFIASLSYDEATALASLGAKVLFPTTLLPTKRKDIPVFVGSSLHPEEGGTTVTRFQDVKFSLKAVTFLQKKDYGIISFVGCHLDLAPNLVTDLKNYLGEAAFGFYDLTSVSISFKVVNSDPSLALILAHEILIKYF